MMQELIVYLVVALAAAYIVRTLWLSSTNKKGCGCDSGGCGKMSKLKGNASTQPARDGLVQVTLNFNNTAPKSSGTNGAAVNGAPNGSTVRRKEN